jgi:hypothetical protein
LYGFSLYRNIGGESRQPSFLVPRSSMDANWSPGMPRPLTPPDRSHCGSCQYKHTDDDQEKDERHQEKEGSPHFRKHDDYLLIHRPSRLTSFSVLGILPCWYLQILFRIDQLLLLRLWRLRIMDRQKDSDQGIASRLVTYTRLRSPVLHLAVLLIHTDVNSFYTYRYMYIVMDNLEQSA